MAALMGAGTFAVHQLRFALTFRHGTGDPMAMQGHAYLVPIAPVLAGLLLVAFAVGLGRMARGVVDRAPRFRRLWIGSSASLFAVYCAQESIEGMVTAGHPGGLQGVIGHGGWIALPLALAVGLAIAMIMRGAAVASALIAARAPWQVPESAAASRTSLPPWIARTTRASARHLAARGPPAISV
jgi:hypothetical protein